MENYFVVLQLPESCKFNVTQSDTNFVHYWSKVADAINGGKAKIVSKRQDTGVSEELRTHVQKVNKFKTYVLFNMCLAPGEDIAAIYQKAAQYILKNNNATIIESEPKFQLVAAEA
jgi:hypothetical protein